MVNWRRFVQSINWYIIIMFQSFVDRQDLKIWQVILDFMNYPYWAAMAKKLQVDKKYKKYFNEKNYYLRQEQNWMNIKYMHLIPLILATLMWIKRGIKIGIKSGIN